MQTVGGQEVNKEPSADFCLRASKQDYPAMSEDREIVNKVNTNDQQYVRSFCSYQFHTIRLKVGSENLYTVDIIHFCLIVCG